MKRHDFKWHYRPHTFLSLLNNKPLVRGKLGPAAQKRGFARGSILGIHSIASSSGVSRRFLAKGPVGFLPPANLEMSYCSGQFLTERGYYRARRWRSIRSLLRCRDGGSKRAPEKSVSQIFLRKHFVHKISGAAGAFAPAAPRFVLCLHFCFRRIPCGPHQANSVNISSLS